jgi:hypothetical protein
MISALSNYEGNAATIIKFTAGIGNNNTLNNVMNEHGIINNSSCGIESDLLDAVERPIILHGVNGLLQVMCGNTTGRYVMNKT